MKCVSIVYKKPIQQNLMGELMPIRPTKKNVESYYEKLIQKQQSQKDNMIKQSQFIRSSIGTARSFRSIKREKICPMTQSINILPIRASTCNIMRIINPEHQNKNQKKFRTTLVKKKDSVNFFNLKAIKQNNQECLINQKVKILEKSHLDQNKKHAKLKSFKKLKLIKPTTVLISVDFILNQSNFWTEENIQQNCHKNWKALQECSNIVWLTQRQNSFKKLQKYAHEYGLRLDGVYQIVPKKKSQTLNINLDSFEKDFLSQINLNRNQKYRNEIIFINSLRVQSIKSLKYQQFYNTLPLVKILKCIVHFIQIDINDKQRFNSSLKILSKDKLPSPNSIVPFFKEFQQTQKQKNSDLNCNLNDFQDKDQIITRNQMLQKYEQIKKDFVDYFTQNLKLNMNKKIKFQDSEFSLQYLIGDMLKRNFNLMYSYKKQSHLISKKLAENKDLKLKEKIKFNSNLNELIISKLSVKKQNSPKNQQEDYYKFPVYFWKK